MLDFLQQRQAELRDLCRRFEVRRMDLFGSAARDEFNPLTSDLDFLVAFLPAGQVSAADRYLGLLAGLEDLFKRNVDLVDIAAARNPYFLASALSHRKMLYAA